jgi:hypothetical protein
MSPTLILQPYDPRKEPIGKETNIEYLSPIEFFRFVKQIKKKRRQPGLLQYAGNECIARAEMPAPASMCEGDYTGGLRGKTENPRQFHIACLDENFLFTRLGHDHNYSRLSMQVSTESA